MRGMLCVVVDAVRHGLASADVIGDVFDIRHGSGGKFVASRAAGTYDARVRGPNRKSWFKSLLKPFVPKTANQVSAEPLSA